MIKTKKYKVDILVVLCLFIFFTTWSPLKFEFSKKFDIETIIAKCEQCIQIKVCSFILETLLKLLNYDH